MAGSSNIEWTDASARGRAPGRVKAGLRQDQPVDQLGLNFPARARQPFPHILGSLAAVAGAARRDDVRRLRQTALRHRDDMVPGCGVRGTVGAQAAECFGQQLDADWRHRLNAAAPSNCVGYPPRSVGRILRVAPTLFGIGARSAGTPSDVGPPVTAAPAPEETLRGVGAALSDRRPWRNALCASTLGANVAPTAGPTAIDLEHRQRLIAATSRAGLRVHGPRIARRGEGGSATRARACRGLGYSYGRKLSPHDELLQADRYLRPVEAVRLQHGLGLRQKASNCHDIADDGPAARNAQHGYFRQRLLGVANTRERMPVRVSRRSEHRGRFFAPIMRARHNLQGVCRKTGHGVEVFEPFVFRPSSVLSGRALSGPDRHEDRHDGEDRLNPGGQAWALLDPLLKIDPMQRRIGDDDHRDGDQPDGMAVRPNNGQQIETLHAVELGTIPENTFKRVQA